ncbi:MAG: hypothetical protein GX345_05900 [Clostridiales bacterium]|nr:hypothetical protein [Clostridiales bacterium]
MKKRISKLLAAVLALSLLFTLAACDGFRVPGDEDDLSTTEPVIIAKTVRPETNKDIIEYYNTVINAVKEGKPAVNPKISKNVGGVETENKKLKALVPTLKKYMLHTDAEKADKGQDLTDIFPVKGQDWSSKLTVADVRYASITESDKTYEIMIRFKDEADPEALVSSLGKAFDLADKKAIMEEFEKANDYLKVGETGYLYNGCYIKTVVDKENDQVLNVTYFINVRVETLLTGAGSLADMGSVPFAFDYENKAQYDLDWSEPEQETQ